MAHKQLPGLNPEMKTDNYSGSWILTDSKTGAKIYGFKTSWVAGISSTNSYFVSFNIIISTNQNKIHYLWPLFDIIPKLHYYYYYY